MEQIDHAERFKQAGISATSINDYYRSPAHFWRNSSFNPDRIKLPPTPAMILGRLAHTLVLTPEAFDKEFVEAPNINRRTNAGKEEWAAFEASAGKREVVTQDQMQQAESLREAIIANSAARQLIGNGVSESPATWHREEDGPLCKARLDYLRQGLVIEYKTTADARPDEFAKSIANFGYHRQLAWQMEAAEQLHGERPKGAIIIAQEKDMPEAIGIYALGADDIAYAMAENDWAYEGIKERLHSNDWCAYPQEIKPISLPHWYGYKHDRIGAN